MVLELSSARVRHLGERFLALQTAIDDLGRNVDPGPLEAELDRVVVDVERALRDLADRDVLASSLEEACAARRAWLGPHETPRARDAAADRLTLALIELALRLRGRPRRHPTARASS